MSRTSPSRAPSAPSSTPSSGGSAPRVVRQMPAAIASFSLSPADSARAVAQVYSVSLLATLPLVIAGAAAVGLHRASAATRALVWRSAAVALVMIYVGQAVPFHWLSWAL